MKTSFFKPEPSSWYNLFFVLFVFLMLFLLTSVLGMGLIMVSYGLSVEEMLDIVDHPDPSSIGIMKTLQVIQSIGMFIVPALIAARHIGGRPLTYLRMNAGFSYVSMILVVLMMVIWIPAINFTADLNARLNLPDALDEVEEKIIALRDSYQHLTTLFLNTKSPVDLAANLLIMAVLPAVGEELLFRGIFQPLFAGLTRNMHVGILIASLLFSFFHFEFYGFLPRLLLGMLFGYLFVWTASLWIPILAHFVNNAIIVAYYFFLQPGTGSAKLDEWGTQAGLSFWLSMGGGILLMVLLFFHERSRRLTIS